ncbi:MAG: diaminopimelate decarboxylase [Stygiobacter sp. RIFOXYC12_FULL_38_8]|nr:MAG: diaminopimelate decarboxylase [Stygiobacter sp. RIFOXYA12_FULL_38_9]OGV06599.1 MAG: diaminopimelate decarboxylase [Stygiobacter sp. RIFOXYB2_FULL_37_11]OGV13139.1 MAG: diaminopimelate decarboxylase [Stygiobacter sp. RIFOXYC2_FULL_38_25]OGV17033.1 MAG: diaminopimelate decarboxylase [Stygiobacter sp. RIFOXYA2_FULL_38_8]OGV23069.1 MAG: diaminopimelate decarboxylase [Stygiobacter sp. RIFOXYC12_FULL_38_8]OGV83185.1 MAG: diaminopimelate decarboxylase [Stygiobacter sp. GWF2_38_21]
MKENTAIDNASFLNYAEKYGTPLYIYDGDYILNRYQGLYDYIKWPKLKILYAMKANYNVGILNLLKKNNAYLDTVSPGEVHLALKLGFNRGDILFTSNNITDDEMHEVKQTGVLFNIGSLSRLKKLGAAYPGSEVCIRFNPDVYAGENKHVQTAGAVTKFGVLLSQVNEVLKIVKKYNLKVVGLHEHTGSGIGQTEKVFQSMINILAIAKRKDFPDLRFVDFGGGFKVNYRPEAHKIDYANFGKKITSIFAKFCKDYGKELEMYFEPGKYIVAESGYLMIEVNTIKNNRGRLIAGTNSGFNHLIRPLLYESYHHIENISNPKGKRYIYDVCGNICETGDCFAQQRELPEIREGDKLIIKNAGAYCYSMGSIYNLRAMPSEILVVNGKELLVTKKPTNQELADSIIASANKRVGRK